MRGARAREMHEVVLPFSGGTTFCFVRKIRSGMLSLWYRVLRYASRKFDERKGDDARLGRFGENGADDERDHAHMLGCIGYCHGL